MILLICNVVLGDIICIYAWDCLESLLNKSRNLLLNRSEIKVRKQGLNAHFLVSLRKRKISTHFILK